MARHAGAIVKSIRLAALAWTTVALVSIGSAGAVIAFVKGQEEADFVFDELLAQMAVHVEPGMEPSMPKSLQFDPEDKVVVQVWDANGRLIHGGGDQDIPRQATSGFVDLTINGTPWRVFVVQSDGRTVQISQRQEVRDEVAQQLALSAALPILVTLPLIWVLVAFALNRLFRQLQDASRTIAARSVGEATPVPLSDVPNELRSFVEAMNHLLRRQADAIEQQRRFVSDAAHELRTPLAALQILIDTLSQRLAGAPDASKDDIVHDLHRAAGRARALAAQLLKLAEVDTARDRPTVPVDLHDTLLDVIAGLIPLASRRGIEFVVDGDERPVALASPADIATLLSVLADNAVRYSPNNSTIKASMRLTNHRAVVEFCDSGIGIAAEALPRVFDRFYRAAPQEVEGAGLGLSIAKAVADRYGLDLSIANSSAGGVVASVAFPTIEAPATEPQD